MTAQEVFSTDVRLLSPAERLRLAAMILNDLAQSPDSAFQDYWDDEDLHDVTAFSLRVAEGHYPEQENLV